MGISKSGRSGGQAVVAIALAGLMFSVPVKADTPPSLPEIEDSAANVEGSAMDVPPETATDEIAAPANGPEFEMVGEGEASYYGAELAGNRTASGEIFDPSELTAAHRSLPLGSRIRVTNEANGKSVIVRVNDRGPFVKSRIVDISRAAAERISMVRAGKAMVSVELLR